LRDATQKLSDDVAGPSNLLLEQLFSFYDPAVVRVLYTFKIPQAVPLTGSISKHDHDGRTPLFLATTKRNFGMVKVLVQHMSHLDAVGHYGRTSLIIAARAGFLEIVQYLVENGADSNISSFWGFTALHDAAFYGHTSIVEYLIALPAAKLELREKFGRTASDWARRCGERGYCGSYRCRDC